MTEEKKTASGQNNSTPANTVTHEMGIQIFKNEKFGEVRVTEVNGQTYFVGSDVAKALGYEKPYNAIKQHVDNQDTLKRGISDNQGVPHEYVLVNESGVYSLIFGSKLESAKDFKRWVTSDVLPVIRKHGGYIAAKADETPEDIMARALVVAQATLERRAQLIQMLEGEKDLLTAENKKLAPKAEYTDKVLQSTNTYTMTQIAKELGLTSAISLEKKLHDAGIIFKQSGQWMLYAKYQGEGYTQARTHLFTRSDGTPDSNTITVWTEKGRAFIHQMLAQKGGKK